MERSSRNALYGRGFPLKKRLNCIRTPNFSSVEFGEARKTERKNGKIMDNEIIENEVLQPEIVEIVGVRFKPVGKIYFFDPKGFVFSLGDKAIVETVRGYEIGEIAVPNKKVPPDDKFMPLSPVIRPATEEDIAKSAENKEKEKAAFKICEEKIAKHGLPMSLVDVEYTFDNNKIIFCFVAEGRIDFRELVKDLAGVFRTRIELRQIGVRDETKLVGALGVCGRKVCCASFLSEFAPVSVRMAKDQSLSTNPQKISGACGKLICCLNYEESTYEDAYKTLPRMGSYVKTPEGNGIVVESNVPLEKVSVRLELDGSPIKSFKKEEVSLLRGADKKSEKEEISEIED